MSTLPTTRYLLASIKTDLTRKMVFIGGPRQVGKTTFAQSLIHDFESGHPAYLNWDDPGDRRKILNKIWPASERLIVFDEIHKYARWRNLVKGYYDTQRRHHSFLVTGSARLDHYRRGGDALLGRYHYYRMHPFSLPEIGIHDDSLKSLLRFGGFPEPLLRQEDRMLRRWHLERVGRLISDDLRNLERVREISLIEQLADALPERVGSPLSVKNLAEDLQVDFKTANNWVSILENLYYAFRIPPFGAPKIRAVKKEQKLYLWDWSQVPSNGARFENLVASHLLKYCHFIEDTEGYKMELRFLRDTDGREIDFVVLKDKKPEFAVECKTGERLLSSNISYYSKRTRIPRFYQVHLGSRDFGHPDTGRVLPFTTFCRDLNLV